MRKVGIYTFINSENYGALLQACALSQICMRYGYRAEFINVADANSKGFSYLKNRLWYNIRFLFGYSRRKKRTQSFKDEFIFQAQVPVQFSTYTKFIVGSDQVWNPYIIGCNSEFLLGHIGDDSKKVAYAASFGINNIPSDYVEEFKTKLSRFSAISVRESDGIGILKSIDIEKGCQTLDPTLLLSCKEWAELLKLKTYTYKYILCYLMPGNPSNPFIVKIGRKLAEKNKMKLVIVGDREYLKLLSNSYKTTLGPREFVEYISNAAFVLTNSFHGTCFSVNFNKSFRAFVWNEYVKDNRNSRILSLLTMLKLESNLSSICSSTTTMDIDMESGDFITANAILSRERDFSLSFIQNSIQ